jgi:hypothetical protein
MIGASLVVLVTLGQTPSTDPSTLIRQLGAARYSERETAASQLEQLGRSALPALRTARESKDLEVRTRATALVEKIEGILLTQATLLRLDFDDKPLPEVLKELSRQAGVKFALGAENSQQWRTRKVTIHESKPLPFWRAVDRLCETARLQYNVGVNGFPNGREPVFPLFEGGMKPSAPTVDTGPFRISLVALHFQRDLNFQLVPIAPGDPPPPPSRSLPAGARPGVAASEQFYAQIQVFGEPRLTLSQNGPLKILEAIDGKGQPLTTAGTRGASSQRTSGYFGFATGSVVQVQATMTRPEQPGKTIRKLKAVLPLAVATRKPNPLVVKLAGSAGQTFRNDDLALTVHDLRPVGDTRQTSIDVSVRPLGGSSGGLGSGIGQPDFVAQRPDSFQQQIEVMDTLGRPMPWYQTSFDPEASRMTLTATPQGLDQNVVPVEIRFYAMARSTTEVEFEFSDLPLP